MSQTSDPRFAHYVPTYFLASLGAGGLVVTFFMWLYFWVPHPDLPVPVFEHIAVAFAQGGVLLRGAIVVAAAGILIFSWFNLSLLVWNLRGYADFKKTAAYERLKSSPAEASVLAMPLAIAMSINVGFILGMVFVPSLWRVVEYLFPMALVAFLATGVLALRQLGAYLSRILTDGGFDWQTNGSFAQMLPAFALSMVGVGLSSAAAMSVNPVTSGIAVVLSSFFFMAALVVAAVAMILGVWSMFTHGAQHEALPTIMLVIPLLTVLGILLLRQNHGLHVHFGTHGSKGDMLILLSRILSVQLLFAALGVALIRRVGYASRFVTGPARSAGAYGLVCPGVALVVMSHFWINKGLVGAGIIAQYGVSYWVLNALVLALQFATIGFVLYLNRRHFGVRALARTA